MPADCSVLRTPTTVSYTHLAELFLAASHIEFVIHRIEEHDADDASSGVCTDGAADGGFYQLLWRNSLQQKVFGILQGIGIFPVEMCIRDRLSYIL